MTKEAVVAGAGPVGSLLAVLLAEQGWSVNVYEKRRKPERTPSEDNTQAYLMNMNHRTVSTLKEHGFPLAALTKRSGDQVDLGFYGANGRLFHGNQALVTPDNPTMIRVFRDEIARHIIDEAERRFPDRITFHFEEGVSSVNLAEKKVIVSGQSGDQEVRYNFLAGADGAGSRVRAAVQEESEPGFVRRRHHDIVYTTVKCKGQPGDLPNHAVFIMHNLQAGAVMLNARGDGDVRVSLCLPQDLAEEVKAGCTAGVRHEVKVALKGLPKLGKEAVLKILDKPGDFHPIAGWTYLSRLYGPSTILLGDAAHTMTPMLGQGCNSGLEDARLFVESLKKTPDNLDAAFQAYNAERLPDIHAIISLNEIAANERFGVWENEGAVRHLVYIQTHAVMMRMHQILGRVLQKSFPNRFGPPRLIQSMMGKASYRSVFPAMYRDTFLLTSAAVLTIAGIAIGSRALYGLYQGT